MMGLGLNEDSRGLLVPGNYDYPHDGDNLLTGNWATQYRALVARANYLAQDRTDIMYAVKELCKYMCAPDQNDWENLKRLGRYLKEKPRVATHFYYQEKYDHISIITDSDWAGDRLTRKSTSGGIIKLGSHTIKGWSSTQKVIAKSSGEAELYAVNKGASIGLGIRSSFADMGVTIKPEITISTDSSTAKAICQRRGLGKVRHIDVEELWIQEKVYHGTIVIKKIDGKSNESDALTKHLGQEEIIKHMKFSSQSFQTGRHLLMPETFV